MMLEALEPRRHFNIAPDNGFATSHRFVADLSRYDSAYGMARQSDGKIVVATDGPNDGVLRLSSTGQRDNSFVYPADLAGKEFEFDRVAVQSDGKIVAGGRLWLGQTTDARPVVVRFNTDGSLDSNFGSGGIFFPFADTGTLGTVAALQMRSDGKILFIGNYWKGAAHSNEYAAQITSTGTLDSGFGTAGVTTFDFAGSYDEVDDMAVMSDGRIMLVGWGYFGNTQTGALARLTASGKRDTTFDGDGLKRLSTPSSLHEEYLAIALRPDGNLVIAGGSDDQTILNESLVVTLINSDGVIQSGFGTSGRTRIDAGGDIERIYDVALDSAGRIYGSGGVRYYSESSLFNWDLAIMRFTPGGLPDPSFNSGKVFVEDESGQDDISQSMLFTSPTQLLLAGSLGKNVNGVSSSDTLVTAYTVDAPPVINNASISGALWNDADSDGVKDATETALAGWTLYIDSNKNGAKDAGESSTTSDAAGNFTFAGLAAGSDRIREVVPTGWRRTSPSSGYFDVTLAAGQKVTGKNFGNTINAMITGTLWKDLDGDGIKDGGEPALAAWKVFLDTNKNGTLDTGERSATSTSSGAYSFSTVPAGNYRVRAVQQSSWRRTAPTSGYYDLTLAAAATAASENFAFTQNVLISGTIFNDLNGDRAKNGGESGLGSWRVFIDADSDGIFDTTERSVLTDSAGNFSFKALPAGTYKLRVVQQSSWKQTTPTAGYYTITLSAGATATGKLFGEKHV